MSTDQPVEDLTVQDVRRPQWRRNRSLATFDQAARERREVTSLRRGRRRIERGWCQNVDLRTLPDGSVEFCVATAPMDLAVRWTLAQVLDPTREPYGDQWRECPDATMVLVAWNDAPERTQDEVLALYDAAIWATENDREPGA